MLGSVALFLRALLQRPSTKGLTLKIRRIASSLALATALTLGATGCGLIAPQGTTDPYSPSDGVDATVAGVEVRNLLLVADETGENFNVVFTAVNNSTDAVQLRLTFVSKDGGAEASADFLIEPGSTSFGNPDGAVSPVLVSLPDVVVGSMLTAFLQVPGGADVERQVPVLDGTLAEYKQYVLSPSQVSVDEPDEEGTEEAAEVE